MYRLSEETIKIIESNVGLTCEEIASMDTHELTSYIEKKTGKKMSYSQPDARHTGSGDDSCLIDEGKYSTNEDFNKKMDALIKHHKSKKNKRKSIIEKDQDFYK